MPAAATPTLRRLALRAASWLWTLALAAGAALIGLGSLVYFADEPPPFLLEKLPLPHEALWLFAVRVHVVATVFSLPACLLLRGPWLLRRARAVHRWLGRVTAALLLGVAVPSGAYLALFAKGGLPSSLGFWLSGAITAWAMVEAVRMARQGDLPAHRRAADHVLAQLAVAVSSRALLAACDALGVDPVQAYLASLWAPVLGSVLAVELLHRKTTRSLAPLRRNHEAARVDRSPVQLPARLGASAR
jgi:uncharacterized membrane protein